MTARLGSSARLGPPLAVVPEYALDLSLWGSVLSEDVRHHARVGGKRQQDVFIAA
ncbi:hypothetical protein ACFW1M_22515 [Streptomyces inhibens]|uniref:hypothetical protein n=1 Tax=Streptomyces inhibens TaxID=2293571 RepID=UPI0036C2720A